MKRYYYELLDEQYNELGALIPDGSHKTTAINRAKAWMKEHGVSRAVLSVNSMSTSDILDMIDLSI